MTDGQKLAAGWGGAIAAFISVITAFHLHWNSAEGDQLCHKTSYEWSQDITIGKQIREMVASGDRLTVGECTDIGELIANIADRRTKDQFREAILKK